MERTGRKKYFYKVIPIQNLNITKNLFVLCMSFSPSINKMVHITLRPLKEIPVGLFTCYSGIF